VTLAPAPLPAYDGGDWRVAAACRHVDPNLFFPVGATGRAVGHIASAKAVCAGCAVREPCLGYALDTRQDAGVWGGLSEEERHVVRRRRGRYFS
jgi:WhiB family redox-sensing transcriptional regulator